MNAATLHLSKPMLLGETGLALLGFAATLALALADAKNLVTLAAGILSISFTLWRWRRALRNQRRDR